MPKYERNQNKLIAWMIRYAQGRDQCNFQLALEQGVLEDEIKKGLLSQSAYLSNFDKYPKKVTDRWGIEKEPVYF